MDQFPYFVGTMLVLFFFAGVEWKQIDRFSSPSLQTLPTTAMRSGNFSHLTTALRDPLTGHEPDDQYRPLFSRIVNRAPAPVGLG